MVKGCRDAKHFEWSGIYLCKSRADLANGIQADNRADRSRLLSVYTTKSCHSQLKKLNLFLVQLPNGLKNGLGLFGLPPVTQS